MTVSRTLAAVALFCSLASAENLKPKTIEAWDAYVRRMEPTMTVDLKATPDERALMERGQIYVRRIDAGKADGGLIHHWRRPQGGWGVVHRHRRRQRDESGARHPGSLPCSYRAR